MNEPIILASGSEARARLLRAAGVEIEIIPARVDEGAVRQAMAVEKAPPRDVPDALAELKAARVSSRRPGALVLGADQILEFEGRIHDKPRDRAEAREQLTGLSGKTHRLMSAAVVAVDGEPVWRHVAVARLHMRPLSEAFVDDYLDRLGDTVLEIVGAYQLEGLGAQLFSRVEGDHFVVQGLPLLEILDFLRIRRLLKE